MTVTQEQVDACCRWTQQFTRIDTPRLYARRLTLDDDQALFEAMQNPRVYNWISGFEKPFTVSGARRWLTPRLGRMERGEGVYGGVFYQGSNVMMGFMHAVMEPELGGVELAGALSELYWGKGFMEEMGFALIIDLFGAGVEPVVATTAFGNYSSERNLIAFNFEKSGEYLVDTPHGERPSYVYRLSPERFRKAVITPAEGVSPDEVRARRKALLAQCQELKARRNSQR